MENKFHTIILTPRFANPNYGWLQKFVFRSESSGTYTFVCNSYKILETGFVEFEARLKSASEQVRVLLPSHSIDGILDEDLHKTQLGFLDQENNPE